MSRLLSQEKIVGFALDAGTLYRAQIALSGKRVSVESLEIGALGETKGAVACAVFPSAKTLARHLTLALWKTKDIETAFLFEAEPHLPFAVDTCVVDKIRLSTNKTGTELQLFAAPKEDIKEFLDTLANDHIDPEILCPKPQAISHFAAMLRPEETYQLIIDMDHQETCCLLLHNGKPLLCRSHPEGLEKLQATEPQSLGDTHLFLREIARILLSFQQHSGLDPEAFQKLPVLYTGPLTTHPSLTNLLSDFLGHIAAVQAPIPANITVGSISWETLCSFAAPIGCALSHKYLQKELTSTNFRKDEFAYGDRWRRWKKELILYFCLMLAISGAAFATTDRLLEKQRLQLVEKYALLLSACEKPIDEKTLVALSREEISRNLLGIEKELATKADDMPLHPDIPRVSDLLAWLVSHPQVESQDKSLRLESLNYTMTKRPEKGRLKDRYQVRVDLEFSAPNATMAREFHDALLAPNPFVDPKMELKWSAQKGHFRASFFLKDRTQYPQTSVQGGSVNAGN